MNKLENDNRNITESLSINENNLEKGINKKSLMWTQISIFVTVFFGIVTIIFGIAPYINNESICYEQISSLPLVNINSEKEKISVLWNNKEVEDPRLILLKITNNGFKDISDDMYITNMNITFNSDSDVISAEIYDATNLLKDYIESKDIHPSINKSIVQIPKMDINKNEAIYLKIVVSNYKDYSIGGRIKGISAINQRIDNKIINFIDGNFIIIIIILWVLILVRLIFKLRGINKLNKEIKMLEKKRDSNIILIFGFFKELEKIKPKLIEEMNKEYVKFLSSKDKLVDCFIDSLIDNKDDKNTEYRAKLKEILIKEFDEKVDKHDNN